MYRMMIAAALLVTTAVDSPVMAYKPGAPSIKGQPYGEVSTAVTVGGHSPYERGHCTSWPCNPSNFTPSTPSAKPKPKP